MYIPNCRYCGSSAKLYSKDGRPYYTCSGYPTCDAMVGCHPGTVVPVGFLANRQLRQLRRLVHQRMDPLWHSGQMTRDQVYRLLRESLGLTHIEGHVGMLDEGQCTVLLTLIEGWEVPEEEPKARFGPTFGSDRLRRHRVKTKRQYKKYDRFKHQHSKRCS